MTYFKIIAKKDCPFCIKARLLLMEKGVQFEFTDLDCSPVLLQGYKSQYQQGTVPIVVLKDLDNSNEFFIGGFTDLVEYFKNRPEDK